jgi:sugar O-acyltransferase (sialic acid O-acetyltransferase NeuD family)
LHHVILGAGGHAKVLREILGWHWLLIEDDALVEVGDTVVVGVGDMGKRRALFERFRGRVQSVWDRRVWLSDSVEPGEGFQFMAGVIIQPNCVIGDNVLINTRASVDHDCRIGSHTHIAPGAILCGGVTLGEGCFIGAGAVIVQGVTLEAGTFVPAGTIVAGPDDFRMPQRVVLSGRARTPTTQQIAEYLHGKGLPFSGYHHSTDAQPQAPVDYPCDTERPRSDP